VYGGDANINVQLANYWSFHHGWNIQSGGWDTMALRGGDALRTNPRVSTNFNFSTDARKDIRGDVWFGANRDFTGDAMQFNTGGAAFVQARSNIDVNVALDWTQRTDPLQYITQVDDSAGRTHFVFGTIQQTIVSLTTRVNWTFSPKLSLQAYAQPFIAAGNYSELKDVDNPHAKRFEDRFYVLSGNDYSVTDGTVSVSHNGTYAFARPDFDFAELRSTVVLRWEYRPGSAVFAIWSHGRTNFSDDRRFDLANDIADLGRAPGEHIVMVKANYWIGL